jgi:hypothetical protein
MSGKWRIFKERSGSDAGDWMALPPGDEPEHGWHCASFEVAVRCFVDESRCSTEGQAIA